MKKLLTAILICSLCFTSSCFEAHADVAGLIPCKDSAAFSKRLKSSVRKLETRLAKYEASTPPALALEAQINKTKNRFERYGKAGLLCGSDGLPHLISDGRWNRAGDFVFPGLLFIYIAGWIGWVGRGYLQAVSKTSKPTEKEIIIDVPLALKFSASGFTWPLAAWQEFTSGNLIEAEENITVSPR
uniref:Photosystem I reaction center subunit III n=1 Tax=Helminthocladia australis TaxID=260093 RepID=A0A1G4NTA4_9FLOR|nr:Photosystem I reaction center subunit III (plastocyanin-binding) [Helminthocladia australis]SCW21888.1 Photosystem I reaction center subunit III (plastocyanin-binding) [Helminthocladia australis]